MQTLTLIKKLSMTVAGATFVTLGTLSSSASALSINNGIPVGTVGSWTVDVLSGGESRTADLTANATSPNAIVTENVLYDYFSYVDIGNGGFRLNTGTPVSSGINQVTSSGSFLGSGGNTINWNVVSSIASGSAIYKNNFTFTADTGTLGNLKFYQYLDEDIENISDDFLYPTGSAAGGNLELFTIDSPRFYGVSQSGSYNAGQGLSNAPFTGWAANLYNNIKPAIAAGTQAVSPTGVINNLGSFSEPRLGGATVYGLGDIVSVLSWKANSNESTTSIVTTLGGVPSGGDIPRNVPEPSAVLSLIALGGLGLVSLKRKQK
jgi:hypothetical protein